ncbi:hypothetical protein [Silanimonas lenta]|uniref:hypothetical protein n=1 Tax=Silanimonas lenta TaxID=265429 RepID=UPI002FE06DD2
MRRRAMPVMPPCPAPAGRRRLPGLVLAVALGGAGPAPACELDGLSHGYGPVSALFAGLHRGTPLDGREDAPPPETPPASAPVPAASGAVSGGGMAPGPRRSFARWARPRPAAGEAAQPALPAQGAPGGVRAPGTPPPRP